MSGMTISSSSIPHQLANERPDIIDTNYISFRHVPDDIDLKLGGGGGISRPDLTVPKKDVSSNVDIEKIHGSLRSVKLNSSSEGWSVFNVLDSFLSAFDIIDSVVNAKKDMREASSALQGMQLTLHEQAVKSQAEAIVKQGGAAANSAYSTAAMTMALGVGAGGVQFKGLNRQAGTLKNNAMRSDGLNDRAQATQNTITDRLTEQQGAVSAASVQMDMQHSRSLTRTHELQNIKASKESTTGHIMQSQINSAGTLAGTGFNMEQTVERSNETFAASDASLNLQAVGNEKKRENDVDSVMQELLAKIASILNSRLEAHKAFFR